MKVIAAILVDMERSPIGTPSRLAELLAGQAVLRRTVSRVTQVEGLASVHVLAPSGQYDVVTELLDGVSAEVHRADWPVAPHQRLVQTTRKWALDNWRGGIGGACGFDESFHAAGLKALMEMAGADGVMLVPAHAALLNVDLAEQMVRHFEKYGPQYRMTFAQSPPGLTPVLLEASLVADLDKAGHPPGMILAYNPAAPEPDLVGKPICCQVPTLVACTAGRLLADTAESFNLCQSAIESLGETLAGDALAVCRFVAEYRGRHVPLLPAELEIELTTCDASADTVLRPRGKVVPARGPADLVLVEEVLRQLGQRDDSRVVFGGFGDPLRHAEWSRAIDLARKAGVFGVSVHTTGRQLAAVGAQAILTNPPDLLVVWLDAAGEETYEKVHGAPGYSQAVEAVLAVERGRQARRQLQPLLVPAMTKAVATVEDQEAFVDFWLRHVGAYWVEGYSDRAGQCPRLQVASMAPPGRGRCRRLHTRMMMLADGLAVACDQDFRGIQPIGDLRRQGLSDVWRGAAMNQLREYPPGAAGQADVLCARCQEWARP